MLRKLYRKIFNRYAKPTFTIYKENGNIITGERCSVDSFSIHILNARKNFVNIEIGDDCCLLGSIVLLNPDAKVTIGNRVFIGENTKLFCYENIILEDDIMFSWGCTLIDTNAHALSWEHRKNDVLNWNKGEAYKDWEHVETKRILIKSKCWIGFNSIISKGVILEEGTIVASGSVVIKNSEPFTIIGGNPATFIKKTE
jgi:acetyltransferase-like isoleucine patch superfamily enzyme